MFPELFASVATCVLSIDKAGCLSQSSPDFWPDHVHHIDRYVSIFIFENMRGQTGED